MFICLSVCQVNGMGMEVCATLGMLTEDQAKQLKDAGLTAYNHNVSTAMDSLTIDRVEDTSSPHPRSYPPFGFFGFMSTVGYQQGVLPQGEEGT